MTQPKGQRTDVRYRDRQTQDIVREINQTVPMLKWLYEHPVGIAILRIFLNNPLFSWLYGAYQTLPHTRRKIADFVTFHQIDTREIECPPSSYRNFNAFFPDVSNSMRAAFP